MNDKKSEAKICDNKKTDAENERQKNGGRKMNDKKNCTSNFELSIILIELYILLHK